MLLPQKQITLYEQQKKVIQKSSPLLPKYIEEVQALVYWITFGISHSSFNIKEQQSMKMIFTNQFDGFSIKNISDIISKHKAGLLYELIIKEIFYYSLKDANNIQLSSWKIDQNEKIDFFLNISDISYWIQFTINSNLDNIKKEELQRKSFSHTLPWKKLKNLFMFNKKKITDYYVYFFLRDDFAICWSQILNLFQAWEQNKFQWHWAHSLNNAEPVLEKFFQVTEIVESFLETLNLPSQEYITKYPDGRIISDSENAEIYLTYHLDKNTKIIEATLHHDKRSGNIFENEVWKLSIFL